MSAVAAPNGALAVDAHEVRLLQRREDRRHAPELTVRVIYRLPGRIADPEEDAAVRS